MGKRDIDAYLSFIVGQFCLFAFEDAKVNETKTKM